MLHFKLARESSVIDWMWKWLDKNKKKKQPEMHGDGFCVISVVETGVFFFLNPKAVDRMTASDSIVLWLSIRCTAIATLWLLYRGWKDIEARSVTWIQLPIIVTHAHRLTWTAEYWLCLILRFYRVRKHVWNIYISVTLGRIGKWVWLLSIMWNLENFNKNYIES